MTRILATNPFTRKLCSDGMDAYMRDAPNRRAVTRQMTLVLEWWASIATFRMEEPPRGSWYHRIYCITARAYRSGGAYIPDYERQPDPGDVDGVASYWECQLRQYREHLADGGPEM